MRNLRPTGQRVLVDPAPPATQSGGILMPEAWAQPTGRGTIVAVGQTVRDLKPGDRIIYNWIDGMDVEHQGKVCRLLQTQQLLGVIE